MNQRPVLDEKDFTDLVDEVNKRYINERLTREIHTKSGGHWYWWQRQKIENHEPLSHDIDDRFSDFIVEMATPVSTGEYHLHSFYDQRSGHTYWKVTSRSTVCKRPGRCIKVRIDVNQESRRH